MKPSRLFLTVLASLFLMTPQGCGDSNATILEQMKAKAQRKKNQEAKVTQVELTKTVSVEQSPGNTEVETIAVENSFTELATTDNPVIESTNTQPRVNTVEEHRKHTISNLKKIATAIKKFQDEYGSEIPVPSYLNRVSATDGLSWRVMLLPYLGYDELYAKFDISKPYFVQQNLDAAKEMPAEFMDATSCEPGTTRILAVTHKYSAFGQLGRPATSTSGIIEDFGNNPANFLLVIEAPAGNAVNWAEPNDFEVELEYLEVPVVYPTGTFAICGNRAIVELEPDLAKSEFYEATVARKRNTANQRKFSHTATAKAVLATSQEAESPANNSDDDDTENQVKQAKENSNGLEVDSPQDSMDAVTMLVSNESGASPEELKLAARQTKTSLVFPAYESYISTRRFGDAWTMHQSSLVLSEDKLSDRFRWSSTLARPVYGFQVGIATLVQSPKTLTTHPRIQYERLDIREPVGQLEKKFYDIAGAPAGNIMKFLKGCTAEGKLGPWAKLVYSKSVAMDSASTNRNDGSEISKRQGNFVPAVRVVDSIYSRKNFLDLCQIEDLDFAVLLEGDAKKTEFEIKALIFDVQQRKLLFESEALNTRTYQIFKANPLSVNPLLKWCESFEESFSELLETEELPVFELNAVRERIRKLLSEPKSRVTIRDFLECKLYLDRGLISGLEFKKIAASWSSLKSDNRIDSELVYERLEAIEDFLPNDWQNPLDLKNNN